MLKIENIRLKVTKNKNYKSQLLTTKYLVRHFSIIIFDTHLN